MVFRNKKILTSTIGPLALQDGRHTNDETTMADNLNCYFASVFTNEDADHQPVAQPQNNNSFFSTCSFQEKEILLAINKTKVNKTPGPDKISPRILKEAKNELVKPLTIIFNKSFTIGRVPDKWKLANVFRGV